MDIDLKDFSSDKAKIKYGCARRAVAISEDCPEEIYPDYDFFTGLLEGDNNILKWTAIKIIGNLSKVDNKKKIDRILPTLTALLSGKYMITAVNTIGALAEIAINRPEHLEEVVAALLGVENAAYYNKGEISPECTNVAIGHVLKSFKRLGKEVYGREDVGAFLKRQTENRRPKVRDLADKLLMQ